MASDLSDDETKTPKQRMRTEFTTSGSSSESLMETANEVDIESEEWAAVAKKKGKKGKISKSSKLSFRIHSFRIFI